MNEKKAMSQLPYGDTRDALPCSHFPAHFQAVIWRNWGMVPRERIAQVIGVTLAQLDEQAALLGLEVDDSMVATWLKHGYQTIIRQNWHLLDYPDMLTLLGWSAERLSYILREDDFLWIKMGRLKPQVPSPKYVPLTDEQLRATARLRESLQPVRAALPVRSEWPFAFKFTNGCEGLVPDNGQPGLRMAYSYSALYGDPLLDPSLDLFPDKDLERYAASGINALWMHAVLYSLVPWLGEDNPVSEGWQTRLANLRRLCQRLAAKNIRLLLYLNEPRALPDECFEGHESWRGAFVEDLDVRCFCPGNPEVLDNLRLAVKRLFTEVPELDGLFCITHNENITNCWSYYTPQNPTNCPVCLANGIAKTITSVVKAIADGVHEAKPDARVLVFNWDWRAPWDTEVIKQLPTDITLMCTSENQLPTAVGGIEGAIEDYSISKPGPGPTARRCWNAARERGLQIAAKVQLNNSWEMSAVPYLPVPGLVEEHLDNLRNLGISDFMVSWSLGGYPGGNLSLLTRSKEEVTREEFGAAADTILAAYACFESGFRHFPFCYNTMLYCGPHNFGPANLFYENPTGYSATMVGFAYDDMDRWRGLAYPEEVMEHEYETLCSYWRTGLQMLAAAESQIAPEKRGKYEELCIVSDAAYCHFRCAYLHIRFFRLRKQGEWGEAMRQVLTEEMAIAQRLLELVRRDSRIGFEASNHYCYSEQTLLESIVNCRWLLDKKCGGSI